MRQKRYTYCRQGARWYLSYPFQAGPTWVMSESRAREVLAAKIRTDRRFPFVCPRSDREIERGKKYAGKEEVPMYNVVTRYVTWDDAEHKTEDAAREHVATAIKLKIKNLLQDAARLTCDGVLTVTDIYALTEILYTKRGQLQQTFGMEFFGDQYEREQED